MWILDKGFYPFGAAIIAITMLLSGCQFPFNPNQEPSGEASVQNLNSEKIATNVPRLKGKAIVELMVNGSPIKIKLNGEMAPITAGNFVDLVQRDFYEGLKFHRVVKQPEPFMVQGGDPKGDGTGGFINPKTGQRRYIPLEIVPKGEEEPIYGQTLQEAGVDKAPELTHTRGALSMARSQMPNSASSQFFITLAKLPFLDGQYAVLGYVTHGMDVVDNIQKGDRIESARVVSGGDNLQQL